jgi:hypothetical protein
MFNPPDDDTILKEGLTGPKGRIIYAIRRDNSKPASEGLRRLKRKDYRKYSRFKVLFIQYVQAGILPPSKLDQYVGTPLWKFKHSEAYPFRIPCFWDSKNATVLTHVFEKKGKKQIQDNIKKALTIRKEHLSRFP